MRGNVNVVGAGKVAVLRQAQKSEVVRQNFQRTVALNDAAALCMLLQNFGDDLLNFHIGERFSGNTHRFSHFSQFGVVFNSQFVDDNFRPINNVFHG